MQNAIVRVPSLEEMGVVKLINGPEAFTPDGEFILGPTDVRGLLGRGRASARTGSPARAGWGSSSPSGSSRARRRSTSGTWTRAASAPRTARASTRSPGRRRSTRRTTTSSTPATSARPVARCGSRPPTRASASSARPSGRSRAGSGRTGSSRTRRPATSRSGRAAGRGSCGRRRSAPSTGRAARRRRSSTSRRSRRSTYSVPAPPTSSRASARTASPATSGRVTYTQMLNPRGGIECDFTVTRLGDERFRIVTGTAFGQHDAAWIRQHAPADGSVQVVDVTSAYACLGLWGPASRAILQPLTTADLSNETFRYMTAQELDDRAGAVPRRARHVRRRARLGALLPDRVRLRDSGTSSGRPGAITASSPAATRRSTRCGSRRATASGVPTSRRRTRRTTRGSALR